MIGSVICFQSKRCHHRIANSSGNGYMDLKQLRPTNIENPPVDSSRQTIQLHLILPESEQFVSLRGKVSAETVATASKNVSEADSNPRLRHLVPHGYGDDTVEHTGAAAPVQNQDSQPTFSVSVDTTPACAPTRTYSAPALVEPDGSRAPPPPPQHPLPDSGPSAATTPAAGLASSSSELRVMTWNIAAPNNNPFEFWASCAGLGEDGGGEAGEGDGFARLMAAVQVCRAAPRGLASTRPALASRALLA
jgi:hypothetical protein